MDTKDQVGGSVGDQNVDTTSMDRFPEGMRVLAVDDDRTSLDILEAALRKCNYQVTTADHAYKALQILRENRNKFDLVISDVQMPDMDGFQLLQLLGNEMHLPVIMLSGDGDTELMKKGISHGACCYLVKPVNIEVFKTIWQLVFREKRLNGKVDQCKSLDEDEVCNGKGGEEEEEEEEEEEGNNSASSTSHDENRKQKRKRKHQDEEDEDENEESSTRKKPRLVWTTELHQKFLEAYDHLGPKKAVPKHILELMNVEGLSRANVASHLQKFREQQKKGNKESSYMPGGVDEFGGRHSYPAPLAYIPPHQMLQNESRNQFQVPQAPVQINQLQQRILTTDSGQFSPSKTGFTRSLAGSSVGYNSMLQHGTTAVLENPKHFDNAGLCGSSTNVLDSNGYGETWQGGIQGRCGDQLPSSAALLRREDSNFVQFPANYLCFSSSTPQIRNILNDLSSVSALPSSVEELRDNMHLKNQVQHVVPTMYGIRNQWWEDQKQDYNTDWNIPSNLSDNGVVDPLSRTVNQNDAICSQRQNSSLFEGENSTTTVRCLEEESSSMLPTKIKLLEQATPNDALDNQVQPENDEFKLLEQEFGFDALQEQKVNGEYDLF